MIFWNINVGSEYVARTAGHSVSNVRSDIRCNPVGVVARVVREQGRKKEVERKKCSREVLIDDF